MVLDDLDLVEMLSKENIRRVINFTIQNPDSSMWYITQELRKKALLNQCNFERLVSNFSILCDDVVRDGVAVLCNNMPHQCTSRAQFFDYLLMLDFTQEKFDAIMGVCEQSYTNPKARV